MIKGVFLVEKYFKEITINIYNNLILCNLWYNNDV